MTSFKDTQYAFIQHIKNPKANPQISGIDDRRLKIYRELFYNNILGFLSSGFPVLESLYTEDKWHNLVRKFFIEHASRSPYFIDISKEFVEYLSNEYQLEPDDPLFIKELAHYEWLELDVSVRKSSQLVGDWDEKSVIKQIRVSDLASLVSYQYPVHQISSEYQPEEVGEVIYLVIYRDDKDEVNFSLLNAVSAFLLNTILEHETINLDHLSELMGQAMPQLTAQQVNESLLEVVKQLLRQQILLLTED